MFTVHIFEPILSGTVPALTLGNRELGTYRRQSLAIGGDNAASFSMARDKAYLEYCFENLLMGHVEEYIGGQVSFTGYIHALRLSYNGITLIRSLDSVYNSIRVKYKTSSGGSETITGAATDTASQAVYGARGYLASPGVYLNSTTADQYRDNLLAQFKQPRTTPERVTLTGGSPATLRVDIRGYIHTEALRWRDNTSTSTGNAHDEISAEISGSTLVSEGTVDTNTAQVVQERTYDYSRWARMKDIAALGDASGNRWQVGCYQSRNVDYTQTSDTDISYYLRTQGKRVGVISGGNGGDVTGALIQPGKVAFIEDILGVRPVASPLMDDPRAIYIEAVDVSRDAVSLTGRGDKGSKNLRIEMALDGFINKTETVNHHFDFDNYEASGGNQIVSDLIIKR